MSLLGDNSRRGPAPTIVALQPDTNGDSTQVYVFDSDEPRKNRDMAETRQEIFQCLYSMLATFSFGIMLGWPSPTYPNLLDPIYTTYPFDPVGNFSIPSDPGAPLRGPFMVTMIQSPLVAGLLMLGVVLAIPFSSRTYTMSSIKHGLLVAILAMFLGWVILWQASNVYHLLVSRFIIGLGNGYAVGQIKTFIQNSSLPAVGKTLMGKMINMVTFAGVACAYTMGIWLDFDGFAIGALVITAVIYMVTMVLPFNIVQINKTQYVEGQLEMASLQQKSREAICSLFTTPSVKRSTWLLVFLTFVQQFSGAPATVVYSQVLLLDMGIPPSCVAACALFYLIVYIAAYSLGIFYFATFSYGKKRAILLFSLITTILTLVLIFLILHLNLRETNVYIPLVGMCLYIFFYGIGLGAIPNTFVEHLYEPNWRNCAGELQLMCFSLFAVIITKLLQVFIGEFPLEYAFVLHICVAIVGVPFVWFWLPKKPLH